jgi:hypothetical protein
VGYDPLPADKGGDEISYGRPQSSGEAGLGQPEEKPGGDTAFNADAGARVELLHSETLSRRLAGRTPSKQR